MRLATAVQIIAELALPALVFGVAVLQTGRVGVVQRLLAPLLAGVEEIGGLALGAGQRAVVHVPRVGLAVADPRNALPGRVLQVGRRALVARVFGDR